MVNQGIQQLEELIGRAPDPVADRDALMQMRDGAGAEFCHLVTGLHTHPDRQRSRLGTLMPGLALLGSPRLADLLGVRAVNAMARAEIVTWRELAATAPSSLVALSGIGPGTAEEVLTAAVREWASAYLREDEGAEQPINSTRRASSQAPGAAAVEIKPRDLSLAFDDLERTSGFSVLKRCQLDPGTPPTLAAVAIEQGISRQRGSELQATARRRVARQMRDRNWPIRVAAEEVRERFGAVATVDELDEVFVAIDPDGAILPTALPHRRTLLLQLAGFRIKGEWILGADIESLTCVVLSALVDSESPNLDAIGRHLHRLGVREKISLRWIVSQQGFRIIAGELVRQAEE